MKKKRRTSKTYTLFVTESEVILTFSGEGKEQGNKIVLPNSREPRVVAPLPDVNRLIENARYFAAKGLAGGTVQGVLSKYIRDREA